jgi:hypothetical protein
MITNQQLENADKAIGLHITDYDATQGVRHITGFGMRWFNPLDPTKIDLLDLTLALDIAHHKDYGSMYAHWTGESPTGQCLSFTRSVEIINDNKHAALAEAVVSVASQIWESKQ